MNSKPRGPARMYLLAMCLLRISLIFPSLFGPQKAKKNTDAQAHTHTPPLVWSFHTMLYSFIVLRDGQKLPPNIQFLSNPILWFSAAPRTPQWLCLQQRQKQQQASWQPLFTSFSSGVEQSVTYDSARTADCKSQQSNSLLIDTESLIRLMAPHHSLWWMDVSAWECVRARLRYSNNLCVLIEIQ